MEDEKESKCLNESQTKVDRDLKYAQNTTVYS
jgi:hypothetical protein